MFGWSWTGVSVLGSHVFGQALMEIFLLLNIKNGLKMAKTAYKTRPKLSAGARSRLRNRP